MKRKVVKHGSSTLTVSLPADWTRSLNIQPGDELFVNEKGRSLVVSCDKELTLPKYSLNIDSANFRIMESHLYSLYKSGYNEIEIRFSDPKIVNIIRSIISTSLMGYEITEQGSNKLIIKNVLSGISEDIDVIIRRNFLVVLSIARSTIDFMKKGNLYSLRTLRSLEYTSNQFASFLHRQLIIKGYKDTSKTIFLYEIVMLTERIGDHYRELCDYLSRKENKNLKINENVIALWERALKMYETFYELFYKPDHYKLVKLSDEKGHIISGISKLSGNLKPQEDMMLCMLYSLIYRIDDFYGSYLGFIR